MRFCFWRKKKKVEDKTTQNPEQRQRHEFMLELHKWMIDPLHRGTDSYDSLAQFGYTEGVISTLASSKEGLEETEAERAERKQVYGENVMPQEEPETLFSIILDAANDWVLWILTLCAVISIAHSFIVHCSEEGEENGTCVKDTSGWLDGVAIIGAVLICIFVGALTDYAKELEFRALQNSIQKATKCRVIRHGDIADISLDELVVGDIVALSIGDFVPADGIIIDATELLVDESSLTGESDQIVKTPTANCFAYGGTMVFEGRGSMLVTAVGVNTQSGEIFTLLQGKKHAKKEKSKEAVNENASPNKSKNNSATTALVPHMFSASDMNVNNAVPMGRQELSRKSVNILVRKSTSLHHRSDVSHQRSEIESRHSSRKVTVDSGVHHAKSKEEAETIEDEDKSILKAKLDRVVVIVGLLGLIVAIFTAGYLIGYFIIKNYIIDKQKFSSDDFNSLFMPLIIAVTILVVAIPEGLPLAVNLALAFSVRRMAKDQILVRHLDAGETVGNATTICSDKTGTLTTNKMTCVHSFLPPTGYFHGNEPGGAATQQDAMAQIKSRSHDVRVRQASNEVIRRETLQVEDAVLPRVTEEDGPTISVDKRPPMNVEPNVSASNKLAVPDQKHAAGPLQRIRQQMSPIYFKLLHQAIAINTAKTSRYVPATSTTPIEQLGNKTECALLKWVDDMGGDYEALRKDGSYKVTSEIAFNSKRKFMSTVIESEGKHLLFVKGASEVVTKKCAYWMTLNGTIEPVTDERYGIIRAQISTMANSGLRTLALAYREVNQSVIPETIVLSGLTLLSVFGIEDPVRPEVPHAIELCEAAGIIVRMVTGDNIETAKSIAIKCGILPKSETQEVVRMSTLDLGNKDSKRAVMTQRISHQLSVFDSTTFNERIRDDDENVIQELFNRAVKHLRVLARATPQDKHTLVEHLIVSNDEDIRQIVAVTGDGTNDAPALKRADVGFAMGISGTEVAKEACDIIITDDNFYSIVKAVMWGRNVYDSVSKFLQFQLCVNVVALFMCFVSAVVLESSIFKAIQMLWVNLVMDTLASLALATEAPTEELLSRPPKKRTGPIISPTMWKTILCNATYQVIVLLVLIFYEGEMNIQPWQCKDPGYFISTNVTNGSNSTVGMANATISGGNATNATGTFIRCKTAFELTVPQRNRPNLQYTFIFNTFVMMTLIVEITARNLNNEHNPFRRIHKQWIFLVIWILQVACQILIIEVGGHAFGVVRLTIYQWMFAVGAGCVGFIWAIILSFVPLEIVILKTAGRVMPSVFGPTELRRQASEIPSLH